MIDPGLNDLQRRALQLTLDGWPLTQIANYLEISRQAIYKWRKLPAWQQELKELMGDALEARNQRVQRIISLALEQIERSLIDPEIAPLKRAELAIKWLTLLKENVGEMAVVPEVRTPKRTINPEVLRIIRRDVYGLGDPEVPNTPQEILGSAGTIQED